MSEREEEFLALWRNLGPEGFTLKREHHFDLPRRWRFDFAELDHKVAIEIEGITHFTPKQGRRRISRHQTAKGFQGDLEKYNRAVELGWRVLRYSQQDLTKRPLDVIEQIEHVLEST